MPKILANCFNFIVLIILMYVVLGSFFLLNEKRYVYYPHVPDSRNFGDCPALSRAEKVIYEGSRFYYQHVSNKVAILYHGNAGNACNRAVFANLFENSGFSYLIMEYPGYGNDTSGGPSKKRILESVSHVQAFLREKNYATVALVGESLGVGIAAYHASTAPVDRLILISPYNELSDMAGWIGFVYPVGVLMRENYTPGQWLNEVKLPILFIYASNDEIIPKSSMERLFNASEEPKYLVEIEGATHNSLYNYPEFFSAIEEFLKP